MGLYMSVQCGEERPATLTEARDTLLQTYPRLTSLLNYDLWLSEMGDTNCRMWQPDLPLPIENEPVTSDVPALLLSGDYDPITPPAWATLAAETLTNAQIVVVPDVGHGVIRSSTCAARMAAAYLDALTQPLSTACGLDHGPLSFYVPRIPTDSVGS